MWFLLARFWVINIELRLDLGTRGLKIASTLNLKSGPRFAKVWYSVWGQVPKGFFGSIRFVKFFRYYIMLHHKGGIHYNWNINIFHRIQFSLKLFCPPGSKASWVVANLTERKKCTHLYTAQKFVCLSIMNFDLNYQRTGLTKWAI